MANEYIHHKTRINKKIRNIIMISLIFIFFILTPILVFYTSGYSFDFQDRKIKKTGVLSIDIKPKDAQVYINEILIDKTIPIRLYNKIPSTYHLKLTKDGYKSWEKDIVIFSNQTTYIKDITLIKENLPFKILDNLENIINIYGNNQSKNIIILTRTDTKCQLFSYDTEIERNTSLLEFDCQTEPYVETSPFQNIFYLENTDKLVKQVYLANLNEPIIDLKKINFSFNKNEQIQKQWLNTNNSSILIQNKKNIFKIQNNKEEIFNTSTEEIWFIDKKNNFWIFDKKLFLINQSKITEKYNLNDKIEKIIDINENRIIAISDRETIVYKIIDGQIIEKKYLNGTKLYFFNQEWWLLSDWEINAIYEDARIELINRGGYKILDLSIFDDDLNFLIKTENSLMVFNPGYFISTKLLDNNEIKNIITQPKKRILYFLGNIGNQSGIFTLEY